MTLVERVAAAIAASRTGTIAGWQAYRADAVKMIARYGERVASPPDEEIGRS